MNAKIYAASVELDKSLYPYGEEPFTLHQRKRRFTSVHDEAILIAGKSAGMCYSNDDFFEKLAKDDEGAARRFDRVVGNHHHSVAEHAQVEVVLSGISKVLAMILNNQGVYNTSEKSGRYTTMTGDTELEKSLYKKWHAIFYDKLIKMDAVTDESHANKLANENARYMLNIFSPMVNMCYTCSIARWTYLVQWMEEFVSKWEMLEYGSYYDMKLKDDPYAYYCSRLCKEFEDFCFHIRRLGLYIPELVNKKGRSIDTLDKYQDILPNPYTPHIRQTDDEKNVWPECLDARFNDGVITTRFTASYASLAQLQRHRTAKFEMSILDGSGAFNLDNFYVPKLLLDDEDLDKEWINDLKSLHDVNVIPIASKLMCKMTVTFDNFVLMMMERCCGRAQLETMHVVSGTHSQLWNYYADYVAACQRNDIKSASFTKCQKQQCSEPCSFIKNGLIGRWF